MYVVYNFFSKRGFICHVMTDIKHHDDRIVDIIYNNKVDDNMFSFIHTPDNDRDPLPMLKWNIVLSYFDLYHELNNISYITTSQLVIYYTGHSTTDNTNTNSNNREECSKIILPNNDKMSVIALRDMILSKVSYSTQVLEIFDSCYIGSTCLPYTYLLNSNNTFDSINNINHISDDGGGRFVLTNILCPLMNKLIHISSSSENESSLSSTNRSYFTKYLINLLTDNIISIPILLKKIQEKIDTKTQKREQSIGIYSSYNLGNSLWSWILPTGSYFTSILNYAVIISIDSSNAISNDNGIISSNSI